MYKRILQLFALVLICFAASVCLESDAFAAEGEPQSDRERRRRLNQTDHSP